MKNVQIHYFGAKPPKSKNSFLLSTSVVSDSQGVQECRRLVANIIGINEEKQFEALSFLLDNLEGDLFWVHNGSFHNVRKSHVNQ